MRVRTTVTLDIDPEAWAEAYGVEPGEVGRDVQLWAAVTLVEQARESGVLLQPQAL